MLRTSTARVSSSKAGRNQSPRRRLKAGQRLARRRRPKAIQPMVEKMITLAKRDTLHTRRQAASFLTTPASVKKLFDTLGSRFGQRNGGYTRITRLGNRKGDGAELAMLELVGSELVKRADERAKRKEARLKAQQEGVEPEEGTES